MSHLDARFSLILFSTLGVGGGGVFQEKIFSLFGVMLQKPQREGGEKHLATFPKNI